MYGDKIEHSVHRMQVHTYLISMCKDRGLPPIYPQAVNGPLAVVPRFPFADHAPGFDMDDPNFPK